MGPHTRRKARAWRGAYSFDICSGFGEPSTVKPSFICS
jgi:hypothetical protein